MEVQKVTPRPPKRYAHFSPPLPSKKEKKLRCSSRKPDFTLPINPNLIVEGTSPGIHHPRGIVLQEQSSKDRKTRIRVTTGASTPVDLGLSAWSVSRVSTPNPVV
ncbi:hypothetical protein BHM03_00026237 [Ensete ventricosum]|nr:hypothetical protein BHM03_00026237 [Ensete ventricosum]